MLARCDARTSAVTRTFAATSTSISFSLPMSSTIQTLPGIEPGVPGGTTVTSCGRTPRMTSAGAPAGSVIGNVVPATDSVPSRHCAGIRFIGGVPMKPATKRFAGLP